MCTIDKMLIKGIRSFSPDNQAVIEFYKPLTLIVGQNGAGKTTVIECLKMACTGVLPPNAKSGQLFIHDPKVAGESEVKAQIKLRFKTASEQPVVIIRSFQLTQKKLKLEYKALDQVLQTHNRETGQKEALTYRCADMDRIVPNLMGVSQAILENVIFVHQEDSNWPLSEGKVLKVKFDDIFAATKYTKALEALKKLRSEKVAQAKEFKLKLDHLRTHKDNAHKLQADIDSGQKREGTLTAQIASLDAQLATHNQEIRQLDAKMSQIGALDEKRKTLATRIDMAIAQNEARHVQLAAVYGEEDLGAEVAELEQWQKELGPQMEDLERNSDKMAFDIKTAQSKANALKQQFTGDLQREAHLAAEAEANRNNVAARDRMLRDAAAQTGYAQLPPEGALLPQHIDEFSSAFAAQLRQQEDTLKALRASNMRQDDEMSRLVDQASSLITSAEQKSKMTQQALQQNELRIGRLQTQVEACSVSRAMADEAEETEKAARATLEAKQANLAQQGLDTKFADVCRELEDLQRQAAALRKERDKLAAAAEGGTRLRLKKQEMLQKQTQIDDLLRNRQAKLCTLLGCNPSDLPPAQHLKERSEQVMAQRRQELADKARQLQEAQQQASSRQGALDSSKMQGEQLQNELNSLRQKLQSSLRHIYNQDCSHQGLGPFLDKAEKDKSGHMAKLERVKSFRINVVHWKDHAMKQRECNTCGRPLNQRELQNFLTRQDSTMAQLPQQLHALENEVRTTEQRLQQLKALQPVWLRLEQLQNQELPATLQKVNELEGAAAMGAANVDELATQHAELDHQVQEGQQLVSEVIWQVDRLAGEVAERQREVDKLSRDMAVAGAARTVSDVDNELDNMEAERSLKERTKDDLQRKQGRLRDEVSHLQTAWHTAREEALTARNAATRRSTLEKEIEELQGNKLVLEHDAKASSTDVEPLKAQRDQRSRERQERRQAARERESEIEQRVRELERLQRQVQEQCRLVTLYESAGKAARLAEVRQALQRARQQQEEQEAKVKVLEQQHKDLDQQRQGYLDSQRQIEDILVYRKDRAKQADLQQQLEQVKQEAAAVGNIQQFSGRWDEINRASVELRSNQDMARGSLGTVREGIQRAQRELSHANFRKINERHRMQQIEWKTTEMVTSDLEKYYKALEKALLAFHTAKMSDINKIVKELWQKTYRNQDIDYIQIKAEADSSHAGRSYNYRVVMLSGGAELDMRGRCSAGQKVLACLIIRLALAETFCLNCGILALDEPTTNLDAANSDALAEALRNIMETRKAQTNFQLVVITHDERFAHMIGTREHAEYLWRITKDENQHSHIAQEELLE